METRKRDDDPVFNVLRNSSLHCKDCVLAYENDLDVATCYAFPNLKPGSVLDGGKCPKHMTQLEADKKYGNFE